MPWLVYACESGIILPMEEIHRKTRGRHDSLGISRLCTFSCYRNLRVLCRERSRMWVSQTSRDVVELGWSEATPSVERIKPGKRPGKKPHRVAVGAIERTSVAREDRRLPS